MEGETFELVPDKRNRNCASRCLTKRTFTTEKEALEEMKWLKSDKDYKKLKRAYRCTLCGNWHLTKKPKYIKNNTDDGYRGHKGKYTKRYKKRKKYNDRSS